MKVAINIRAQFDEQQTMKVRVTAHLWAVLLLFVGSCGFLSTPTTVRPPILPVTTTTTTAAIAGDIEMSITGCSAPPVTFALLCEVVDLLDSYHVDPPDHAALAEAAIGGVRSFESTEEEAPPRGITCAVPGRDFAPFCEAVEQRMEVDLVPLRAMVESAVASMLVGTVDPYTIYVPPELSGAVGEDGIIPGLGMVLAALTVAGSPCVRIESPCPLQVVTVLPDGPADRAGLMAGDVINTVDGEDVSGLAVVDAAGMMSGDPGTTLMLEVDRDGAVLTIEMTRADDFVAPITSEMVGSTGYLRLPEFGIDSHVLFHFALESLIEAGATRLVLDLRDNPGGFLFSVSLIGSEFFSTGLLYRTAGPNENLDYPAVEGGIAQFIPTITLVNGSSASAAEILAAVLQERDRSVIVGLPTFGKNLVQVPFELHNEGQLRITISRWTTPAGASVEGTGVLPDVPLDLGPDLTVPELVDAAIAAAG